MNAEIFVGAVVVKTAVVVDNYYDPLGSDLVGGDPSGQLCHDIYDIVMAISLGNSQWI